MVASFKKMAGIATLSHNEEIFNDLLSRAQVISEHTFGMLKCRFPWLRHIRQKLESDEDIRQIMKYIKCAIILHNVLIYSKIKWPPVVDIINNLLGSIFLFHDSDTSLEKTPIICLFERSSKLLDLASSLLGRSLSIVALWMGVDVVSNFKRDRIFGLAIVRASTAVSSIIITCCKPIN